MTNATYRGWKITPGAGQCINEVFACGPDGAIWVCADVDDAKTLIDEEVDGDD